MAAAQAPAEFRPLLDRLIAWADDLNRRGLVRLATYRGKNQITTLLPRLRGDDAGLATVYLEPKNAYIQLWPTVFKRRAPGSIAEVTSELGTEMKPHQRIFQVSDGLLSALTAAYEEAAGRQAPPK
ncbi:hypothetical protein Ade02nite_24020 [Paractinoplanes deccanensis]|uniref:Uncharacterized protein n=1 Tax=Paractinoplanes deccanensis TaxID=113561 RepID=A0ABQ3Y176_9ACTN|nr:hypothetical protein [Actinoplanes deccanensis]GID73761.1 hypothetical protein Ade02nite_24020 [Actinoplanes deccanensis]